MTEVLFALNFDITTSEEQFAQAGWRGPWVCPPGTPPVCPECRRTNEKLGVPMEIAWDPGVGNIGDFTWMWNNTEALVTERAATSLARHFDDFEFAPIVFRRRGNPFMRRTRMMTYNGDPLPDGFRLMHLKIKHLVSCDLAQSSLTLTNRCDTCKREGYDLEGVENWVGRKPGKGIFVPREAARGFRAFRVRQYCGPQLVTELVRKVIEDEGLTNVVFVEYGEFC